MFPEGGGFVNVTDPEGGPTATGMIPEGGTTEKNVAVHPPHRLINGTALTTASNDQLINNYNKCKEQLESLYDYITDEIIMRSHATWYEKGERSTKYFLNLEKRNKTKSHVRKLINPDGSEETNPKNILANIKSFYSELYTRRSVKN